jgi:hypothetical protein
MDRNGSGAYQMSPFSSVRVARPPLVRLKPDAPPEAAAVGVSGSSRTGIVKIWFVPSRNRLVIGAMPASATTFPSGDHVGAPGCGS